MPKRILHSIKDLLTIEELAVYKNTQYPFNLSIVRKALDTKLEGEPEFELWVPLVYYKYKPFVKKSGGLKVIKPYKIFISSKGRVVSFRDNNPKFIQPSVNQDYQAIYINCGLKQNETLQLHRAMACAFVPLPEHLGGKHPRDLETNHINGVKTCNDLVNLEWCTAKENIDHAIRIGITKFTVGSKHHRVKPVKGSVISGPYAGYQFVLSGRKDHVLFGFQSSSITKCCNGERPKHKNCSWAVATQNEIKTLPTFIPKRIRDTL
jgi:hypothetical protein